MKSIGFNFTKNDFRYCVLTGVKGGAAPTLVEKDKILHPNGMDTPELMEWFEKQLLLIIDKHKPDSLSHKISLSLTTLDQIMTSCYPQGILNLIAKKRNIATTAFSSQGINGSKFGLKKSDDVYSYVDTVIGTHKPYWDKSTKEAVLVAWYNLL